MRSLVCASLLAALAACGGTTPPPRADLKVLAFTPNAPIDKAEPVSIRFDAPVVDDRDVGTTADPQTVTIRPAVAWRGHWQDRQTLVIEAAAPLAPGTRYHVALAGPLAARTGAFEMSFVFQPLAVEGLSGVSPDLLSLDGDLPIQFNQRVRPSDAAARCQLEPAEGAPIALRPAPTATAPALTVALRPARPLAPGAAYTLTCRALTAAAGDEPLATEYTQPVHARPPLTVVGFTPDGKDPAPVPADQVELVLTLSTPVTPEAMRAALTATPAIPGLGEGYFSGDGTEYRVTADLDARATYKVHLAALTDTFGQTLPAAADFTFRTGDARPRLNLERGIFALEASAKGYPVWSRNVGRYDVECGAIPKSRIVQLLTSDMQYDPWSGNNDDKPLDWAALHVTPVRRTQAIAERNKWVQTPLDLGRTCGGAARGLFLAELHSAEVTPDADRPWMTPRRNRVLANVTDLGVLLKVGSASGLVWVTRLSNAAPVAGARVTIYTPTGRAAFTGATTADGLLQIPGSAVLKDKPKVAGSDPQAAQDIDNTFDGRTQRLIAVVEDGADLAVVDGNWSNGIQIWNFAVDEAPSDAAVRIRGFLQSDRGLYRPGEQVHFKGLAREITAIRPPRVPAPQPVTVEVTDSRGQSVMTKTVTLSPFGGFAFDLQLATDAALGDYYVAATLGTQTFRERFTVEEFRPAAFELAITGDNKDVRPGDKLAFALDAKYLFGSPLAGAKVEWTLRRRKHRVAFPGFDEYTFSADPHEYWWDDRGGEYGAFLADGKDTTDAQGHLAITASERSSDDDAASDEERPAVPTTAGPVDYVVSASVTDGTDQTIQKSVLVTAHRTSLYLGLHASEYVQAVDMPFGVNLVALRPDGARAAAKARLTVTRVVWTCAWGAHGYRGYQRCTPENTVALERDVDIAAGGSHTERVVPKEPGDYLIRIAGKDDHGRDVAAESEIYVIGKGEAFWSGDEGDRMTIVTSKPTYAPGDTAKLVPMANLHEPTALVTVERDGVLSARVTALRSTSEGLALPIADAWAPNVYASVALVSGRHGPLDKDRPAFKLGTVELKVTSAHKALDVKVSLDAATVRPGAPVTGTIVVTHQGAPVKAEVSLSAADEGVLQLIDYKTPNPMTTFYAPYGLGVEPATNWNRVARLADPTAGDPDQGGDMASKLGTPRVRSQFLASAYWAPALVTDDTGTIRFAFTAPDNLSAFRLMAAAADVADQFGAGEARLTINQPLMAQPTLPRFLRTGDSAALGVLLHNTTDTAGTATVDATGDGVLLAFAHQTVALPAHGEARVQFPGAALPTATTATIKFQVAMGAERDAVQVTLPVEKPRLVETRALAETTLAPGAPWTGSVAAPTPSVLPDESTLTLTLDRTGAGDLAPSLHALVEYPYGCLEQTMSHLVPLLAAKDLAATLDDRSLDHTQAQHFIDVGVAKILRHQQADGQFSLWPDSQTYPHLTAYALWGLTVAEQSGVAVPADVFDRGVAALSDYAGKHLGEDHNNASMAMAAYVMALRGKPDAGLTARLYAARATLPTWGKAFLLRAVAHGGGDRARVAELEKLVLADLHVRDGAATVHETSTQEELDMYWGSDARSTAVTLLALLEVDPSSPQIDALAAGLKSERGANGAWQSTQENLWALVALSQYAKRATITGDLTATVTIGGVALPVQRVNGGHVATVQVPLSRLASNPAVSVAADRATHLSARVTEVRSDAGAGEHHGFTVTRRYLDATGAPVTRVHPGDLVTVRLDIVADAPQRWIAVVDPIPAGFEAVNTKLAETAGGADPAKAVDDANIDRWSWTTRWDYQEMRDDAVRWFGDRISAGPHVLAYQVRATIAGTFTAMPATVEHMYHPELRGRSDKLVLTVAP